MGLDCTFANPNSKIDKDDDNEPSNFTRTDTISDVNLRAIDRFPFAQNNCSDGFGSSIRSLNGSTIADLKSWLSALKSWITNNLDTKFDNYTVDMYDYNIVEAFNREISPFSDTWLVLLL